MKLKKHKIRFVDRKTKKACKNYPCKKTKIGRYLIEVIGSYYDYSFDIYSSNGFEHPYGDFYCHFIDDEHPLWTMDENICERIEKMFPDDMTFEEKLPILEKMFSYENICFH